MVAVGNGLTVTEVGALVLSQPFPSVYVTVYEPKAETMMLAVVAPVLQLLPDG
jgi:hypothetical protein